MLSWKPKRNGKIYCAPACGAGCTYKEYLRAKRDAKKMAAGAKGFKPRVHENMQWYAGAIALGGHINISGYPGHYHVLADASMTHCGDMVWGSGTGKTPQEAVDVITRKLRREITKLQKFLGQLELLKGGAA